MRKQWRVKAMRMGGFVLDRSAMTHYRGKGESIRVPIWAAAATDGVHKVVVDTGINDVEEVRRTTEPGVFQSPEETMPNALKRAFGWTPEEVDTVILTHLHNDHNGNNRLFVNADFYVQKAEWEAAHNPIEFEKIFYVDKLYNRDAVNYFQWNFLDGDAEIFPGLRVITTPGHTRGLQSALFDIDGGPLCVSGDAANVAENINDNLEPNLLTSPAQVYESFKKIRRSAKLILPGHEPSIPDLTETEFCVIK